MQYALIAASLVSAVMANPWASTSTPKPPRLWRPYQVQSPSANRLTGSSFVAEYSSSSAAAYTSAPAYSGWGSSTEAYGEGYSTTCTESGYAAEYTGSWGSSPAGYTPTEAYGASSTGWGNYGTWGSSPAGYTPSMETSTTTSGWGSWGSSATPYTYTSTWVS